METQLTGQVGSDRELAAWIDGGGLRGVESLVLWDAKLTDASAAAIAAAGTELRSLDLSWNRIGAAGAAALVQLPRIRRLRLYHNDVGVAGAAAIAEAGSALEALNMCGNALGDAGLAALACGSLANLRELALGWNDLGLAGIEALVAAPWPHLEFLNLRANHLDSNAMRVLMSARLPALRRLGIDENPIGAIGLHVMAELPGFAQLAWLNLGGCDLDDRALTVLEHAPNALGELRLHDNDLSAPALRSVRTWLPHCEVRA